MPRSPWVVAPAVILALALVLAACGGKAPSAGSSTASTPPGGGSVAPSGGSANPSASLDPTAPRALDVEVQFVTGFPATGLAASDSLVWMTDADAGVIRSMDPATGTLGPDIAVGNDPMGIAVDGDEVWVANVGSHTVMRVDGASGEVTLTVDLPAGTSPTGLALTDGNVWVGTNAAGTVARIDRADGELLELIGDEPELIAAGTTDVLATEAAVWAIDSRGGRVIRIDPTTGDVVSTHDDLGPIRLAAHVDGVFVLAEADQNAGRIYRIDEASDSVEVVVDLAFSPTIPRPLGLPALVVTDTGIWLSAGDRSARITRPGGRVDGSFRVDFRISALVLADGIVWHAVHDSFDESKSGLYGVDEAAAAAAAA